VSHRSLYGFRALDVRFSSGRRADTNGMNSNEESVNGLRISYSTFDDKEYEREIRLPHAEVVRFAFLTEVITSGQFLAQHGPS
jgi:hypothetical protein